MNLEELYKWSKEIYSIGNTRVRGPLISKWFEEALLCETDECILWPFSRDSGGYGAIRYKNRTVGVHLLSAIRKLGKVPIGKETAHGPCNNRLCFNYKHLSYKTKKENSIDRHRDGTMRGLAGELNSNAKVSNTTVDEMRHLYAIGIMTPREIGEKFGLKKSQSYNILNGTKRTSCENTD